MDGTDPSSQGSASGPSRAEEGTSRLSGLGSHDDHSRVLGQPYLWVEQTHQPVLHHPDDGHRAAVAKMLLHGSRLLARSDVRLGQVRLGGELLVQGLSALAPQVGLCGRRGGNPSVKFHSIHLNRLINSRRGGPLPARRDCLPRR